MTGRSWVRIPPPLQVLDREKNPEWDGECTKLVYAFPTNETLWDEYTRIRAADDHGKATELYRRHRKAMDAGAIVAWQDRYDSRAEISAIQHAMNLKLKVAPEAFASEYQNEPVLEQVNDDVLTVEQVCSKVIIRGAGEEVCVGFVGVLRGRIVVSLAVTNACRVSAR